MEQFSGEAGAVQDNARQGGAGFFQSPLGDEGPNSQAGNKDDSVGQ
jgi:hypothetical protein